MEHRPVQRLLVHQQSLLKLDADLWPRRTCIGLGFSKDIPNKARFRKSRFTLVTSVSLSSQTQRGGSPYSKPLTMNHGICTVCQARESLAIQSKVDPLIFCLRIGRYSRDTPSKLEAFAGPSLVVRWPGLNRAAVAVSLFWSSHFCAVSKSSPFKNKALCTQTKNCSP